MPEIVGAALRAVLNASDLGNQGCASAVYEVMSLILLIAFALATTIPCIALWMADARERIDAARS